MFHIHKWSKWVLIKSSLSPGYDRNKRTCQGCGLTQYRFAQ